MNPFQQYLSYLDALRHVRAAAEVSGKDCKPVCDVIQSQMKDAYNGMTAEQQELANRVSAELNKLNE